MDQKTEKKEETEFKVPESTIVVPCGNNCSLTASTMCQKCFAAAPTSSSSISTMPPPSRSTRPTKRPFREQEQNPATAREDHPWRQDEAAQSETKRAVNRCSGCRRRVGLTGFRCRCGELFCAEHRYSDRHDCNFDYKAAGREAIAKDNPVIRAPKIVKI